MSQTDLAKEAGVARVTVSRVEGGHVEELRADTLKRLARALAVPIDYLLGETDTLTPGEQVNADPRARAVFRDYHRLTPEEQSEVARYIRFRAREGKREAPEEG